MSNQQPEPTEPDEIDVEWERHNNTLQGTFDRCDAQIKMLWNKTASWRGVSDE